LRRYSTNAAWCPWPQGTWAPRYPPTVGIEELLQEPAAHLVHRGPEGHLGGLQIQGAPALALVQHAGDYALDFARHFLANRRCNCFFTCASSRVSATSRSGRSWQICSLTSTSSVQCRTKVR